MRFAFSLSRRALLTLLFACAVSNAQTPELIVQSGHTNSVHTVAFSPDGRTILSASADHTLKLWEAATGRLIRNFEAQGDSFDDVRAVFSPDGKLAASISTGDYIKLWDVGGGKLVRELDDAAKESTASISGALAFSPDGKLLAAQTDKFKVWDVASGTLVKTLDGYAGAARFSPDGILLAEITVDSKLNLWDVSGWRLLRTVEANPLRVPDGISFSPDGKTLAVLRQGAVDLWDASGWRVVRSLKTDATQTDGAVIAFSPDGEKLFVSNAGHGGGLQRSLELWDVAGGRLSRSINVKDGYDERPVFADSVSFSPDGQSFVTGGDEQIILWGVEKGEVVRAFGPNRYSDEEKSARLTIFPERGTVTVVTGRKAKLWDANIGLICSLEGSGARLDSMPRNAEGNVIALNSILWDARSCRKLGQIDEAGALAFSHDGRAVAQIAESSIKLYDATFQPLRVLRGHTGNVGVIAFSPDSKLLASGGADNTIRLWDWETGQQVRAFEGHTGYVSALAFSPDGKLLASGGNDRTVGVWDVASGRPLNTLNGHKGRINALAFGPDGKALASGANADETLRLWDVQTGKLLQSFGGSPNGATEVAFSADGAALATWWKTERKDQNVIKLWRADSGRLVLDLQDLSLKSAAFSREGHTFIVASGEEYRDVRTRIYSSASGEALADVIGFTDGRWIVITPSGFFDGPPEAWSQVAWRFGGNQVAPA
ncbi:MAG TPA: WD40 repeat domain-containing protein, partial [Pyrinomonadaceae bacterium]|nr:WD40 repeat domain-containing protein [Pyrinomonadaceae bacterium]